MQALRWPQLWWQHLPEALLQAAAAWGAQVQVPLQQNGNRLST